MKRQNQARVWAEETVIPTYLAGEPNPNPMFLDKRVYQGSSGRVYPYPVIDSVSDTKVSERYKAVFLENRYLKIMVLPTFGGRIQYAYDKTNGYPFIYHNKVIKPALVGLAGPWLSGGIEFNWPQHHRPGTYCPVDYKIVKNADGSSTLWLSEIEPMWHLKGTLGLTIYPDKAFLEITIRLFNPTPLPQSFHLWTNPAVHVNDHYESVFPPDVQAVYDHGKRDVSSFPIARGTYYKVDYSKGVDISWYKNLPVPTSFMAAHSDYNFIGGYDHEQRAGVLHVADHYRVPGKKQWVWGCGDFGKAWDRNLTDGDGPYAELMCGVFADNQPDFSWLEPGEEKETRQYFMPYRGIGYVRNATTDAALSFELKKGRAAFGAYATSIQENANLRLSSRGKILFEKNLSLGPERPFVGQCAIPRTINPQGLRLELVDRTGRLLVDYRPESKKAEAIPDPATAIPVPAKVRTNDALFLAGVHLEQYRHATREPEDYYGEALRRDPADMRCNTALGMLLLKRGRFSEAERYLRAAVSTACRHNPNPRDGEAHYALGLSLRYQGRVDEASDAFQKAAWSAGWRPAAEFQLAQIAACRRDWEFALKFINEACSLNPANQKAAHLRCIILRKLDPGSEAAESAAFALARDPLDFGAANERALLLKGADRKREITALRLLMRDDPHTHIELAADYAAAGCYDEAIELLTRGERSRDSVRAPGHTGRVGMPNQWPMIFYFKGYYAALQADDSAARAFFKKARQESSALCFPNSLNALLALEKALDFDPADGKAAYYLGNLWYDKRQIENAIACWTRSVKSMPSFPGAHRSLALAFHNKRGDTKKALSEMAKAFALNHNDARVLFEFDLLRKRAAVKPEARLALLQKHLPTVYKREDLLIEYIGLLNFFGDSEAALDLLLSRQFHPWEGGEGKVTGQYVAGLIQIAKNILDARPRSIEWAKQRGRNAKVQSNNGGYARSLAELAITVLEQARIYPESFGEGKLHGALENEILYWLGVAHATAGNGDQARKHWEAATIGMDSPAPALYYNDQNPQTIFYQGLALQKLEKQREARLRFDALIHFGQKHLHDKPELDFFAVSLPEFLVFDDDLELRNTINCRYLMGLGWLGRRKYAKADSEFRAVLHLDPSHYGASLHLRMAQEISTTRDIGAKLRRFVRKPANLSSGRNGPVSNRKNLAVL